MEAETNQNVTDRSLSRHRVNGLTMRFRLRWVILIAAVIALPIGFESFAVAQVSQSPNVSLMRAQVKAKTAKKNFETIQRLSQRGSASQQRVRDARLEMNLALIELSNLTDPARKPANTLLRAKLVLRHRNEELELTTRLFQGGSVSRVTYDRALAARDIARSRLKAIQSITETQRKIQIIKASKSKFDIALKEYEIANRLNRTGSVSQRVLDRAKSNLEIARSEWSENKKSLGAKAFEVTH